RRQAPARSAPTRSNATRSNAARSAPVRRRSTREAIRRRPRVASAIAGTATFLAAVYLGMILFSPDSSSAGTPDQVPSSGPAQDVGNGGGSGDEQGG
ncbi:serine/threonine protein kinase, partial [Streptomyces sp. NPDC059346]